MSDLVDRQAAIDAVHKNYDVILDFYSDGQTISSSIEDILSELPSVQPERDIPIKPNETTDRSWGIPNRQAVCPKCDNYLGHVAFLGDYNGKRITYCETCGQAIDWEGWDDE